MNMSMYQVLGLEFSHEPEECLESGMALIVAIADSPGGSMGYEDIQISAETKAVVEEFGNHLEYPEIHFEFGELMVSLIVPHRTAQSSQQQSGGCIAHYQAIDEIASDAPTQPGPVEPDIERIIGTTASGELAQILDMMVSKDKVERLVQRGNDELVVFQRQVTCR